MLPVRERPVDNLEKNSSLSLFSSLSNSVCCSRSLFGSLALFVLNSYVWFLVLIFKCNRSLLFGQVALLRPFYFPEFLRWRRFTHPLRLAHPWLPLPSRFLARSYWNFTHTRSHSPGFGCAPLLFIIVPLPAPSPPRFYT